MNTFNRVSLDRRRFLRQSFAFSALACLGSLPRMSSALAPSAGEHNILLLGDWGYENFNAQAAVAAAMQKYALEHAINPEALLMLGDNWYGALDGGADSPRWRTQFEEMYPASAFACPAYAILGNHDYQIYPGNKVQQELEYARVNSGKTRWTMPARWYSFDFPKRHPLIKFIALDSNVPYADGSTSRGRDFTLTAAEHAEQLVWLEKELKHRRRVPFLAVIAHHPVYSDGPHGDHPRLIRDWDPLLRKYEVPLYMAGHDHDLQHLEFEGHPTSFFLSGGGGADLYDLTIQESQRGPYALKVYGFSHLSVTPTTLTLRHINEQGQVMHAFTKSLEGKITVMS